MDSSSSSTISASVALRASLAARLGRSRITVALPTDAQADDVRAAVAAAHPEAAALVERALVVAGDRILGRADPLPPDHSLALVPPVSGG